MDIKLTDLPKFHQADGSLVALDKDGTLPFPVRRLFYIFGVPNGEVRANHACMNSEFLAICMKGRLKFTLYDGYCDKEVWLDSNSKALYIPMAIWIRVSDFSDDAILLMVASKTHKESEYINSFDEFLRRVKR